MKLISKILFIIILLQSSNNSYSAGIENSTLIREDNSLPYVLPKNHSDLIESKLKHEARIKFCEHNLPTNLPDWDTYSKRLKKEIIERANIKVDSNLPLNYKKIKTFKKNNYTVEMIVFQTLPGIYATANLFIPNGEGPFPAVVHMLGHWRKGKIDNTGAQSVGHSLALNGYVCLSIDPWGSGERTTIHGDFEDHGDENNLGSSLMNLGEPLIGIEISENIRAVDLLSSLPYVDKNKIGATGASGGGNHAMWLAAMDERIKAVVPVVSVGTFESHIMGSPCICEVLQGGLTITEESGILSLIAPRPLLMCNHTKDNNLAFLPSEMLRSYINAKSIFKLKNAENNISYKIFDLTHGYMTEDRESMLGWFDLHLKGIGDGEPKKEIDFEQLEEKDLMVFQTGKRDPDIMTTSEYCKIKGNLLKKEMINSKSIKIEEKTDDLIKILGVQSKPKIKNIYEFPETDKWKRFSVETSDNKLIPILLYSPKENAENFTILCSSEGKNNIPMSLIQEKINSEDGLVIVDLSGTGEISSTNSLHDNNNNLRTVSRSLLWFDKTLIGEWVNELELIVEFLNKEFNSKKIKIDGTKEAGLAGLFLSAIGGDIDTVVLRDAPVSYVLDNRDSIDFFSMGVNLPGIIRWGDISLAAALSGKELLFINPLTISGKKIKENELKNYKEEFSTMQSLCNQTDNRIDFILQQMN